MVRSGFPRVSGDAPALSPRATGLHQFSPRERGCAFIKVLKKRNRNCFPRVSGDAPLRLPIVCELFQFSPRERGCARRQAAVGGLRLVFPA